MHRVLRAALAALVLAVAAVVYFRPDVSRYLAPVASLLSCEGATCVTVELVEHESLATQPPLAPTIPVAESMPPMAGDSIAVSPTATRSPRVIVLPFGSLPGGATPTPAPTPTPIVLDEKLLAQRHGATSYSSIEEMPEELGWYFTVRVNEIASFFGVRAEDVITVLAARNDGGLRIQHPGGNGGGVAQLEPRVWNGLPNPRREHHLGDVRSIEQYGGLGFDWSMRQIWLGWRDGVVDGEALAGARANPERFENSVAAIARYLERWGLTAERAERDPERSRQLLAEAIASFDAGGSFSIAMTGSGAAGVPTTWEPLRAEYGRLMDRAFAVALTEEELAESVDRSTVSADVASGLVSVEEGARLLLDETLAAYYGAARAARAEQRPLPWPFIHDDQSAMAQRVAVQHLGHPVPAWELDRLVARAGGDEAAMAAELTRRIEARLYASTMLLFDKELRRTERGLPVQVHEVGMLLQETVAHRYLTGMGARDMQQVMDDVEHSLRLLPEYEALYGKRVFTATPFNPMPGRVIKSFGAPARYQPGGIHTGIDLRGQRVDGQEPLLFAVDDAVVAHVGPIYCHREGACRGGHAIILDHGNNVYSIYSHNSVAYVTKGERVTAGQRIGRQGNEGYSMGPHLHFEVHVGAPYSGDWTQPFYGGGFVNPMPWLPRTLTN